MLLRRRGGAGAGAGGGGARGEDAATGVGRDMHCFRRRRPSLGTRHEKHKKALTVDG